MKSINNDTDNIRTVEDLAAFYGIPNELMSGGQSNALAIAKDPFSFKHLHNIVKDHLLYGVPISVTRIGDGEAMVLNGTNDLPTFARVLNRQLGYIPSAEDAEQIRQNLKDAYRGSDAIGAPTERHLQKGGYWALAYHEAMGYKKSYASIDFHNEWLDNDLFTLLLARLENLCYISCRDLDQQFKDRFGIKNVYSYHIAPEAMFTSGYAGKRHFPNQFEEIKEWMKTIPVKGSLCLVGAGFTGKIYNVWFKEHGGISLDIGNVFDAWAGKKTRGEGRGLDVEDKTYKL